jgi:hypothetical protein
MLVTPIDPLTAYKVSETALGSAEREVVILIWVDP